MGFTVLIVDDEEKICRTLSQILEANGYRAIFTTDPFEVPVILKREQVNLVILDIRIPALSGIDLLKMLQADRCMVPVIVISGYASVENIVTAMKYGAVNFYTKPIDNRKLLSEIAQLACTANGGCRPGDEERIVTRSAGLIRVLDQAALAAPTDTTILITGESGTGKELVADAIHRESRRNGGPLVKLNCAAIPETLLESELFGYERGAFTDARTQKKGFFEQATGGTIFLDEIGDMSLQLQAKMLRVLQDKGFTRLGGSARIRADVRILAATNRDLLQAIRAGAFREDLYYRLSVITMHIPPLRERTEDILPIAGYFLERYNAVHRRNIPGFSDEVTRLMVRHDWPGNVRELRNFVERAVIFSTDGAPVDLSVVPDQYAGIFREDLIGSPDGRCERAARDVILETLERNRGSRGKAAEMLRISRKTLYNRMKRLKIE